MLKKLIASLLLVVMVASPASAQLNLTYTSFQPGQTISAAQFTANFTAISANALNRTGGTMTGTLTLNSGTDVNGSFTIGSSNLQPFDAAGKIKEISSTYFDNLSGASLTGILEANIADGSVFPRLSSSETITGAWTFNTAPTLTGANLTGVLETAITDGSLLARVAAAETISGAWTFTSMPRFLASDGRLQLTESDQAADSKEWLVGVQGGGYYITSYTDDFGTGTNGLVLQRSGSGISSAAINATSITFTGATTVSGTLGTTGAISANAGLLTTTLAASSNVTVGGTLGVTGNTTLENLTVNGTLTAAISGTFADGTVGTPGIRFTNDTDTGFYLASGDLRVAVDGTQIMQFSDAAGPVIVSVGLNTRAIVPNASATYDIGTSSNLYSTAYALAFSTTSDRRHKMDVENLGLGIEFIDALQPVSYRFVKQPTKMRYGFIAQDLQKLGFAGVNAEDKDNLTLNYTELIAPMVKGMQEMHSEIHKLDQQNRMLQAEIEILVKEIKAIKKGYGNVRSVE
jgi:hypothetical protein